MLDPDSLENLPVGLDGSTYQWVDLDGEGITGILTEQAGAWLSQAESWQWQVRPSHNCGTACLPLANLREAATSSCSTLAGDGQLDLVAFAGPTPGLLRANRRQKVGRRSGHFLPFPTFPGMHQTCASST